MDSATSPKVITTEEKGVGMRSLACSTSRVKWCVGVPEWGLGRLTNKSIIHMNLHKPNNKSINA